MDRIHELLSDVDLVVGFHLKFDLAWLKRYGINTTTLSVWDGQLAEFLISNQSNSYPDLDSSCLKYNLPGKSHIVEKEYWSKG